MGFIQTLLLFRSYAAFFFAASHAFSLNFRLFSKQYRFTVSIMGGDCGETEIYAYIMLDGETVATAPLSITSYGNWDTAQTPAVSYTEGQRLSVGVYVRCQGGGWGTFDDFLLNPEK